MKPVRVHNFGTYFVTGATWERRTLFRSEAWARLFLKTLYEYRASGKYFLHEFVLMPDHFHIIITPVDIPLERAVQFVKGGFSFRAGRELASASEIWQKRFTDHRIRDAADYDRCREYIILNPVRAKLCLEPSQYPFSSACSGCVLDDVPRRLKAA
jgi:REP-associated tyrosine transposase